MGKDDRFNFSPLVCLPDQTQLLKYVVTISLRQEDGFVAETSAVLVVLVGLKDIAIF